MMAFPFLSRGLLWAALCLPPLALPWLSPGAGGPGVVGEGGRPVAVSVGPKKGAGGRPMLRRRKEGGVEGTSGSGLTACRRSVPGCRV